MQSKRYLNDPHDAYEIENVRQQHERHSAMKDARMLGRGRELDNLPEDLTEEMEAQKGKVPFSKVEAAKSQKMRRKMDYVLSEYDKDLLEVNPGEAEDAVIAGIDAKRKEKREELHDLLKYGRGVSFDEEEEMSTPEIDEEIPKSGRRETKPTYGKPNRERDERRRAA